MVILLYIISIHAQNKGATFYRRCYAIYTFLSTIPVAPLSDYSSPTALPSPLSLYAILLRYGAVLTTYVNQLCMHRLRTYQQSAVKAT